MRAREQRKGLASNRPLVAKSDEAKTANLPSNLTPERNEVVDSVARLVDEIDHAVFSSRAISILKWRANRYVSELVRESAVVAKRCDADLISAKHVQIAVDHLTLLGGSPVHRVAGTVGGVGLGTCLSTLGAMMLVWQFPLAGILICVVAGVVGGFLLALSINEV